MKMELSCRWFVLVLVAALLLTTGCGSNAPAPSPSPSQTGPLAPASGPVPGSGAAPLGGSTSGGLPGQPPKLWTPFPEADRLFAGTSGWIGGDGAFAIDLGQDRLLWLFGDSLRGAVADGRRAATGMIHNSVAIQEGRDPATARITFSMGRGVQGVFPASDPARWMWPLHGVRTTRGLWVFLLETEATGQGGPFGFRTTGNALAHVTNPDDPPDRWSITTHMLPHAAFGAQTTRVFGNAVGVVGNTLYVWGFRDRPAGAGTQRSCIVARTRWDEPERAENWRFWNGFSWDTDAASAVPVFENAATETSVHLQDDRWIAISQGAGLSADVVLRWAPEPQGPWSAPRVIFRCPEAAPGVFTYGAKAHPELPHAEGEIVATYATNGSTLDDLVARNDLYRPRFIRGRLAETTP